MIEWWMLAVAFLAGLSVFPLLKALRGFWDSFTAWWIWKQIERSASREAREQQELRRSCARGPRRSQKKGPQLMLIDARMSGEDHSLQAVPPRPGGPQPVRMTYKDQERVFPNLVDGIRHARKEGLIGATFHGCECGKLLATIIAWERDAMFEISQAIEGARRRSTDPSYQVER